MPFKSEAQRRFLYAKHPEIAKRWTEKYGSTIQGKQGNPVAKKKRKVGTALYRATKTAVSKELSGEAVKERERLTERRRIDAAH